MPHTMSIRGKRACASVFVKDFIAHDRKIVFLQAYGPTQELRAFAQILSNDKDCYTSIELPTTKLHNFRLAGSPTIIGKQARGYSLLFLAPDKPEYIIGNSVEECRQIMARILDQQHFVHASWYEKIIDGSLEIPAEVGTKRCFMMSRLLNAEVEHGVRTGNFAFPTPTASLTVEMQASAATQEVPTWM